MAVNPAGVLVLRATGKASELPKPDPDALSRWRHSYNDAVSVLADHFGFDTDWWFVPLSSRDHFASTIQQAFQFAARVEAALRAERGRVSVVCADFCTAAALTDLAASCGSQVDCRFADRVVWAGRDLRRRLKNFLKLLAQIGRIWRGWFAGRRYGPWQTRTAGLDVVFAAPLHLPLPKDGQGVYRDTYFGDLPEWIARRGERTAVTGPALCDPVAHATAARDLDRIPAIPLDSMVTATDAVALCFQSVGKWLKPPQSPQSLQAMLPRLDKFVRREIEDSIALRVQGTHFERAFSTLLIRSPNARVIHTYENNWWERAIDRPSTRRAAATPTVGYLHCAVIESSLKNYRRAKEINRPAPNRVICTGPAARDVLLTLGEYDPSKVAEGCALRAPNFQALPQRRSAVGTVKTILVLLEGLYTMVDLLRVMDKAAADLPDRRIIVRPHPVLSLQKIATKAGVLLAPHGRLEQSDGESLIDEILRADLIVFKASSTALTAGYMGVPLLRYRDDWWLSDDPLCKCNALKVEIERSEEVAGGIAHFEKMPESQLNAERVQFRSYVDQYFRAPTEEAVRAFGLEQPSKRRLYFKEPSVRSVRAG
jgi:hypothetical protein